MKIANWYGGKDFRIEEIPKPQIDDDEVLIKVKAVSICGSELDAYTGASKRRQDIHGLPLVMGHELSGVVAEVGRKAENVSVGDRVTVNPIMACGKCEQCLTGANNICQNFRLVGLHVDGAFAEYVSVPSINSYRISDNLSFEEACLMEPCSVVVHAVNITTLKLGDDVTVLGAGPIGLLVLQAAKLAGAGHVYVTGTHHLRLNMAMKLGADETFNARKEDPVERIMSLTENEGVDAVLDAVGSETTLQQGLSLIKKGKTITLIGMREKTMQLRTLDIVVKEARIQGDYGYTKMDFKSAVKLAGLRKFKLKPLITHQFPVEQIADGFKVLAERKDEAIKVIVKP